MPLPATSRINLKFSKSPVPDVPLKVNDKPVTVEVVVAVKEKPSKYPALLLMALVIPGWYVVEENGVPAPNVIVAHGPLTVMLVLPPVKPVVRAQFCALPL